MRNSFVKGGGHIVEARPLQSEMYSTSKIWAANLDTLPELRGIYMLFFGLQIIWPFNFIICL